jgi:multidrug efflux pump subunit AcrB
MGNGVRRKLEELKRDQPIGIEIGDINFQPTAVTKACNSFISICKAVTIVFVVLLFDGPQGWVDYQRHPVSHHHGTFLVMYLGATC